MAYSSSSIVNGLIAQFVLGATSKPNNTQVDVIIAEVDAELNVAISVKNVAVPVIAPAYFLKWLEGVSAAGAAARTLKSMFPNTTGAGEIPAYAFWQKIYTDAIKGIQSGDMIPLEATTSGFAVAPSNYFVRNPDSEEVLGDIAEPFFQRGKEF